MGTREMPEGYLTAVRGSGTNQRENRRKIVAILIKPSRQLEVNIIKVSSIPLSKHRLLYMHTSIYFVFRCFSAMPETLSHVCTSSTCAYCCIDGELIM